MQSTLRSEKSAVFCPLPLTLPSIWLPISCRHKPDGDSLSIVQFFRKISSVFQKEWDVGPIHSLTDVFFSFLHLSSCVHIRQPPQSSTQMTVSEKPNSCLSFLSLSLRTIYLVFLLTCREWALVNTSYSALLHWTQYYKCFWHTSWSIINCAVDTSSKHFSQYIYRFSNFWKGND